MFQLLAPFAVAVVVFIAFYFLGFIAAIIEALVNGVKGATDLQDFFFIANGENNAGVVLAIIVWIIGTIIAEVYITDNS